MEMAGEEALELLDRERLRVVVEVEGNEMRLLCEGHCDLDKVKLDDDDVEKIF